MSQITALIYSFNHEWHASVDLQHKVVFCQIFDLLILESFALLRGICTLFLPQSQQTCWLAHWCLCTAWRCEWSCQCCSWETCLLPNMSTDRKDCVHLGSLICRLDVLSGPRPRSRPRLESTECPLLHAHVWNKILILYIFTNSFPSSWPLCGFHLQSVLSHNNSDMQ